MRQGASPGFPGSRGRAALGEGGRAQLEFFLGCGGAHQGLQASGGLSRMQGRGEGQVIGCGGGGLRVADGDDRQAAHAAGAPDLAGQVFGGLAKAPGVDDGGFDLQVAEGGDGRLCAPGGDRPPSQSVQAFGEGTRQTIVARKNQNPGVERQTITSKRRGLVAGAFFRLHNLDGIPLTRAFMRDDS